MSVTQSSSSRAPKRKHGELSTDKRPSKKAKSPRKPSAKDAGLDTEASINADFAHMDPDLLADHLAKQTKRFEDDLSLVELEERRIPVLAIRDTTDFDAARTLDRMPDFFRRYSLPRRKPEALSQVAATGSGPGGSKSNSKSKGNKDKGAPHTLVVTGAGLRAADVTRALRAFQTRDCTVAKLFAKHIKLDEAKEYVAKTKMGIGVGTPKRISDLLDAEALSLSNLERIAIDASHIDQKKRGVLDMKELQPPLMDLLNRPDIKDRYGQESNGIELLFF